ncbi:unnamed protein product [Ambrosiozyma monospora]|uniref:Unnamed protein product n=1 Tax=Ambrosiozyma monospora TaxID=43982 RepID=A0ACB5U7E3_AMBMO|nr:unnamed protein product [Ambrosiozyma monospora]
MHHYLLNRSVLDSGIASDRDLPPLYQDHGHNNHHTEPETQSHSHSPPPTNTVFDDDDDNDVRFVNDPDANPSMVLANNLDKLEKLPDSPIKITVKLTECIPPGNQHSKQESPFRQYKPNEVITGYVIIENTSTKPVPFEMFLVSLDGVSTVRSFASVPRGDPPPKLIRHTFLKMYDFCACYHFGYIDVGQNGDFRTGDICPDTGAVYGFNDERVLAPGCKCKKWFMFKLPTYLIDTSWQRPFKLIQRQGWVR